MTHTTLYDFWYSAAHKRRLDKIRRRTLLAVLIDGKNQEYTCASAPGKKEPYPGAVEMFPDYRLIGTATLADVSSVTCP